MKRLVIFLVVSAALLAPSAALASGVVLKVQRATHLVAVTNGKTKVSLVHTAAKLRVGQRVALRGRTLRNGTMAASSIRVLGRAKTVHFRALLLKAIPHRLGASRVHHDGSASAPGRAAIQGIVRLAYVLRRACISMASCDPAESYANTVCDVSLLR